MAVPLYLVMAWLENQLVLFTFKIANEPFIIWKLPFPEVDSILIKLDGWYQLKVGNFRQYWTYQAGDFGRINKSRTNLLKPSV
jgi:hypothetical protein